MHDPRLVLARVSSWWSRPKVWPTSWHITRFLHAGLLYDLVLKYVSFSLAVACVMCSPLRQMVAMPSQPFLPYFALQTSTRPFVAPQFVGLVPPPGIFVVSSTSD